MIVHSIEASFDIYSLCLFLALILPTHITRKGNVHRPHPKDGEGNVFTLLVSSPGGGYPCSLLLSQGQERGSGYPSEVLGQGYPFPWTGPGQGYPPPERTHRGQDMAWVVRLLWSHRRTFLFQRCLLFC